MVLAMITKCHHRLHYQGLFLHLPKDLAVYYILISQLVVVIILAFEGGEGEQCNNSCASGPDVLIGRSSQN
jgi:hypothetical protein